MTFPKPDETYWNNKLAAYLHDPIDKVFRIQGHEKRAADQLGVLGLQQPNESFWKTADIIASGFERGQVPTYSSDPNRNGAVDFIAKPIIAHPISKDAKIEIVLPKEQGAPFAELVAKSLLDFLKANIGMQSGSGGYSDNAIFHDNPQDFAFARFLYVHHGLRFKLAENNVAGLGGLWHRLPADSRFPDHTIWQHNALTSALYSCMELATKDGQVGILSFSITPVQPFIVKARKLRDYWTGSVLLSWLAFEGLRWVMEHLGPDHLLYPSLIDQPLVNRYLRDNWKMVDIESLSENSDIASLPNKFLCLVPYDQAESIALAISHRIKQSWQALCSQVLETLVRVTGEENGHLEAMFRRQTANYWDLQWASAKLIERDDIEESDRLLPETSMEAPLKILKSFSDIVRKKYGGEMDARGLLYSPAHQLSQMALASGKTRKTISRQVEPGQKCRLCTEFEALHAFRQSEDISAHDYKNGIDEFWKGFAVGWRSEADFDDGEALCALCLTKRIAYRILKEDKTHILNACFGDADTFPSTTEMALYEKFKRENINDQREKQRIAQKVHDREKNQEEDNRDRYYAILVMDGDHMGKLINGDTMGATWGSAMHPEIRKRLQHPDFERGYRDAWAPLFNENCKRLVTPAIHAAISESLGDFSIYGVSQIIKDAGGRLIYAGGDDVCAVMPVSRVVTAAREISRYYNAEFKLSTNESSITVDGEWKPAPGKFSLSLGQNRNQISISAGILVCHHKEPLSRMIARAHTLLDKVAKEDADRNACAVELRKRSGGSRFFVRKWDDEASWDAFEKIGILIKNSEKQQVSTSLIYRLEKFRAGVDAIIGEENGKELMRQFTAAQLERSGVETARGKESMLTNALTEIILEPVGEGCWKYQPEGLIVAAFIADAESEVR